MSSDHSISRRSAIKSALLGSAGAAATLVWNPERALADNIATQQFGSVQELRGAPVPLGPIGPTTAVLGGFNEPGDGGGGIFVWDPKCSDPDNGGTVIQPAQVSGGAGRWHRAWSGAMNARWFGAQGNGRTPQDDGIDISGAAWNRWPDWTRTADYSPAYLGYDQKAPPFQNSDSWDFIGIQLALFSLGMGAAGEVYIPGGTYQLTKPVFYTNGMRATLSGAGMYQTILTKKPGYFDGSSVIQLYRVGGQPMTLRDLAFSGPNGGNTRDFTLIELWNVNGVHIDNCWLTVCQTAIKTLFPCSDSFVTNCTAEFCEVVINNNEQSDLVIEGNNFWQSAAGQSHTCIVNKGTAWCRNNKFIQYVNAAIDSTGTLEVTGNHFSAGPGALAIVTSTGRTILSGNSFLGGTRGPMVTVGSDSVVTGNRFEQQADHACLNILQDASMVTVTGNVFNSRPGVAIYEGGLVCSVRQGVSFRSGCSDCLVTGNVSTHAVGINIDASRNLVSGNLNRAG